MGNTTMTIADIQKECEVGRRTAEMYARESGALLPRVKNSPYRVRREVFTKWLQQGGAR